MEESRSKVKGRHSHTCRPHKISRQQLEVQRYTEKIPMNLNDLVYLKPETKLEPLVCGWYAWPYLVAPVQFALNLHSRLLPLLESFVTNPEAHLAASSDPKMFGGPFISLSANDVEKANRLMEETKVKCADALVFAEDLKNFVSLLESDAVGFSLNGFYARLPPSLQGLVECLYDINDHARVRLFEDLVYDEKMTFGLQQICLQLIDEQQRHFFMSTPRLSGPDSTCFDMSFRDKRLDMLAKMRKNPMPFGEVVDEFAVSASEIEGFSKYFTSIPPSLNGPSEYHGDGVRMRYFCHACVLFQTDEISVLFDPMLAFETKSDGRFTIADLPERIDYVVLSHSHQDHVCPEMLIQLRHRIGRIIVPANNSGNIADPSVKLMLRELGFDNVDVLNAFEKVEITGGEILSLPFTGEHSDLDIHSKHAIFMSIKDRRLLFLIDSDGVDRMLYRRIMRRIGKVDAVFLGMECHGAPLAWMYEPLLGKPVTRKNNESRRLSGANCERALNVLAEINTPRVFVYAMGQEPWLQYMMGLKYEPDSIQLTESDKFLDHCKQHGIEGERLYYNREIEL
ncbi:MAG: MBL fold metallo-hydrolase [Lysobacteraceae bacterium]|nr:MAG: MBL fold metallo-hydrolase [Xanthomonadaceae bacterium]